MPGGVTGERYICATCGEDIEFLDGSWVHTDPQAGDPCTRAMPG